MQICKIPIVTMYLLALVVVLISPAPAMAATEGFSHQADVVVYGATPAGIAAVLPAAEVDRDVLLVEPSSRIGGMTTYGLSQSDFHSFELLNGPFLPFIHRVLKYYETIYGKDSQ